MTCVRLQNTTYNIAALRGNLHKMLQKYVGLCNGGSNGRPPIHIELSNTCKSWEPVSRQFQIARRIIYIPETQVLLHLPWERLCAVYYTIEGKVLVQAQNGCLQKRHPLLLTRPNVLFSEGQWHFRNIKALLLSLESKWFRSSFYALWFRTYVYPKRHSLVVETRTKAPCTV